MAIPYEASGRTRQKARTRQALIAAARDLLAEGLTPRVEDAAARAGISRTTAYRYFPNQRGLLLAAQPDIQPSTLLPPDAPTEPRARLDAFMAAFTRYNFQWQPQLRSALRLSLESPPLESPLPESPPSESPLLESTPPESPALESPGAPALPTEGQAERPLLRRGRAIAWIEDALAPLADRRPDIDRHRLAVAIRSATGIESLIWLRDVAGQNADEAAETVRRTAQALLAAALAE
jgi:AcrR family transcriptional regulator